MESNTAENDSTFWNCILLFVIIVILYHWFYKKPSKSDTSVGSNEKSIRKISRDEQIDKIDKSLEKFEQLERSQFETDRYANVPSVNTNTSNELLVQNFYTIGDSQSQMQDKTANGSIGLMNQAGKLLDGETISCNMLGVDTEKMDDYKKKFYSMYAHQIECPSKCKLGACGMGSRCGVKCPTINGTGPAIPDTFALNYLALDNANKKPCVQCNFSKTTNGLNREWMEKPQVQIVSEADVYAGLGKKTQIADEQRLKQMFKTSANVSNYVNFENNVYQNSIGETPVDKINEMRACVDNMGTCGLKDYGDTIAHAYDKLLANPSYTSRGNCDPYQLSGILEDSAPTDKFEHISNN